MRFTWFAILFLVSFLNLSVKKETPLAFQQHVFGIGVIANPTGDSHLLTFSVISFFNGKMVGSQAITKNTFIRMASGDWPSKANPGREDLFLKNELLTCGRYVDTMTRKKVYLCDALDSLWKIRYDENPYHYGENGWSHGKYIPNVKQMEFLYENYEVSRINVDFFIGTFMWKILKDVQDSTWVMNYKSLEDI